MMLNEAKSTTACFASVIGRWLSVTELRSALVCSGPHELREDAAGTLVLFESDEFRGVCRGCNPRDRFADAPGLHAHQMAVRRGGAGLEEAAAVMWA